MQAGGKPPAQLETRCSAACWPTAAAAPALAGALLQPESAAPIWNLRGVNCNSWHRVPVTVQ